MQCARGQALRQLNYPRSAKAYEKDDIPAHNLAAKKEVQTAKVPDMLGAKKAGWNISTVSENMYRFPDRPDMRTLSKYDSHKRADYNYRAETLDSTATAMYIPRPNKFQANERSLDIPRMDEPHHISRCEFPVHPALEGKPRWDPATGHGGDPYGVEKAQRKVLERERVEALEYSRKHPPKNRTESLVQREERYMREQRERKANLKAQAALPGGGTLGATGYSAALSSSFADTFKARDNAPPGDATTMSFGPGTLPTFGPARQTGIEPYKKVPALKQTTWSLGGF